MRRIFIFLFFLISVAVFGEKQSDLFVNFNTGNNMLQHNTVEAVTRDNLGYVWIGTNYGLYRLDGYTTQSYLQDSSDPNSLSNNFIKALYVDLEGDLWIGTIGGGLNKLNRETNNFIHYLEADSTENISGSNIPAITEDHKGNIWIGSTGNGINKLDKKTGIISNFKLEMFDPYNRKNSNVTVLYTDRNGNIWVGLNQSEVFKINGKTEEITYFGLEKNDIGFDMVGSIKGISEKKDGTILLITWNGNLFRIKPETDKKIQLWKEPSFFGNTLLSDVIVDSKNNIWISSWENGLYKIDGENNELSHISRNLNHPNSLGSNALNQLYIDKNENLWISTLDNGLSMLPLKEKMFKTLDLKLNNVLKLKEINVYSIIKDNSGNLWIGTRGQGLWEYNTKTGISNNYLSEKNPGLGSNSILTMKLGDDGKIWIGTDGSFICLFDPTTKTFTQLEHRNDDWSNAVFAIAEDENYLWGATWGGGLKKIDKKTFKYTSINFDNKDQFKNSIFDVKLHDSILWIANVGLGLIRYNTSTGIYHVYLKDDKLKDFPKERINDIFIENSNSLWISTDGSGLFHFIPSSGQFYNAINEYKLASKVIQSSITDNNNNIWVASISGVSHIEPNLKRVYNFNYHNGLLANQLNKSALYFDQEKNLIYTGGVEGVNYFNPDKIVIDSTVNKVVMTELSVMGSTLFYPNSTNISKPIDIAEVVHLYQKEKLFTIHFSSMEFTPSIKSRYFYQLEGFDKEWVETPYAKNFVQYTNLFPGKYTLRVKTCNSDGICGDEETTLKIIVHPAFWQTLFFKLLIMIAVMLIVFLYIYGRYINLIKAKRFLEMKVSLRTKEILHQKEQIEKQNRELELANGTKNKFFTIISHDLRNPMSSINQLTELIMMQYHDAPEDKILHYLDLLNKSSKQTLELLDDLLIWARTQTNRIKLKTKEVELDILLHEVLSFCYPIAQKKNIELQFPFHKNITAFIDKNTILTVFRNLVTNAIKFSHPNSMVKVSIEENLTELIIKVTDNGIGMSSDEIKNLFKIENLNSKKGTSGEMGTGLGLILCYEFLALNGERIWVESEKQKGTTFFFTMKKAK